jgi:hypothetical protein
VNGSTLSDLSTISVNKVWQVWEVKAKTVSLVIHPATLGMHLFFDVVGLIVSICEVNTLVSKLVSNGLTETTNVPIAHDWLDESNLSESFQFSDFLFHFFNFDLSFY